MLTVKQLLRGGDKYWVKTPPKELSSIETLAWSAAADLASFTEMTIEAEDLPRVLPDTWLVLWGLEAYFRERNVPLSQAHALVMLLVERANHGLDPRGDETSAPKI